MIGSCALAGAAHAANAIAVKTAAPNRRPADGLVIRNPPCHRRALPLPGTPPRLPPTTSRSRAGSHADHRLTVPPRKGVREPRGPLGRRSRSTAGSRGRRFTMQRVRSLVPALAGALLTAVAAFALMGPAARGRDERAETTAVVEAAGRRPRHAQGGRREEPRALRPRARLVRHAPHAVHAGRPESRHRRRARLDPRSLPGERGQVRRPDDGRAPELHPGAGLADPGPDADHERGRDPPRHRPDLGRPRLRRRRATTTRAGPT